MYERCDDAIDVLIVDPQPADYTALAAACEGAPFAFHWATTGSEALRLQCSSSHRLWLVNVQLPDMCGLELCEMIRAGKRGTIYLISDHYRMEEEVRCRQFGAALYACKPPDAAWLRGFSHNRPNALGGRYPPTAGASRPRPHRVDP